MSHALPVSSIRIIVFSFSAKKGWADRRTRAYVVGDEKEKNRQPRKLLLMEASVATPTRDRTMTKQKMIHVALVALDFADAPIVNGPATLMFGMDIEDVKRVGADMRQRHKVTQGVLVGAVARCFFEGLHVVPTQQHKVANLIAAYLYGTQSFGVFDQMNKAGLMAEPHGIWLRLMTNSRTDKAVSNVVSIDPLETLEERMDAVRRELRHLPRELVDQFVLDLRPNFLAGLDRNSLYFTGGDATDSEIVRDIAAGETQMGKTDTHLPLLRHLKTRGANFH